MKHAEVGRIAAPDRLQRDGCRRTHAPGRTMERREAQDQTTTSRNRKWTKFTLLAARELYSVGLPIQPGRSPHKEMTIKETYVSVGLA